jgi:hypothetical protein
MSCVRDGEATTRSSRPVRGVGHREARAVQSPGAVATPATGFLDFGEQRVADLLEQFLEQGQGQARPGGTIGHGRERDTGQARQRGAGGIAVEDLHEEDVHGGHRIEEALAPGVAEIATDLGDGLGRERRGDIGLELGDDVGDTESHPWPPVGMGA